MKKIIKSLLVVMIITMVVMAFAACKKEPVVDPCAEGHTMVAFGEDLPTCTEDGLSSGVVCTVCGYAERNRFPIPAKGHKMADATCELPSTCTVCGHTEGEALGHSMKEVEALAPTCTAEGYTAHTACERCDLIEGKEVVEKIAHSFTIDVEALAPTCTEDGYTAHKACECGEVEGKETIPAAHTWVEATCTEAKTCSACGETEGESLGHEGHEADFVCDVCKAVVEPEADSVLTLEQANALGLLVTTTQNKYYITGTVKNVANTFNGNVYITNGTTTFYIYGTKSADGSVSYDKFETPIYEGDTVTYYGYISLYEGAAQMKNGWLTSCVHEHVYSEATCEKLATCACGLTQGELADHNYQDGMCTVCNAIDPDFEGEVTVTVGRADFETAGAASGSYATRTTTNGWVGTNCALLSGGTTDANPKFIFLGDEATRAMTLNGKTSAVGKLVSPTLANGISKLSFKYGHAFSDKNGVDITINIIQNGEVVASYHLDNDNVTQKTAYEFTWTLEEEVKGDFTIEILNNSPSKSTSNKDRVSIWDLEWVSN